MKSIACLGCLGQNRQPVYAQRLPLHHGLLLRILAFVAGGPRRQFQGSKNSTRQPDQSPALPCSDQRLGVPIVRLPHRRGGWTIAVLVEPLRSRSFHSVVICFFTLLWVCMIFGFERMSLNHPQSAFAKCQEAKIVLATVGRGTLTSPQFRYRRWGRRWCTTSLPGLVKACMTVSHNRDGLDILTYCDSWKTAMEKTKAYWCFNMPQSILQCFSGGREPVLVQFSQVG